MASSDPTITPLFTHLVEQREGDCWRWALKPRMGRELAWLTPPLIVTMILAVLIPLVVGGSLLLFAGRGPVSGEDFVWFLIMALGACLLFIVAAALTVDRIWTLLSLRHAIQLDPLRLAVRRGPFELRRENIPTDDVRGFEVHRRGLRRSCEVRTLSANHGPAVVAVLANRREAEWVAERMRRALEGLRATHQTTDAKENPATVASHGPPR